MSPAGRARRFLRENSLGLVFLAGFLLTLVGRLFAGRAELNNDLVSEALPPVGVLAHAESARRALVRSRWKKDRQHARDVPSLFGSRPQFPRLPKDLHQTLGLVALTAAPAVPTAGQPPHVRHEHRIRNDDVRQLPAHR
ncbi:DUF6766 family protein [Streptomyces sp. NPDC002640]